MNNIIRARVYTIKAEVSVIARTKEEAIEIFENDYINEGFVCNSYEIAGSHRMDIYDEYD